MTWRLALVALMACRSNAAVIGATTVTIDNATPTTLSTSDTATITWHADESGEFLVAVGDDTIARGVLTAAATQTTSIDASTLPVGSNTVVLAVFPSGRLPGRAEVELVVNNGGGTTGSSTGASTESSTGASTGTSTGTSSGSSSGTSTGGESTTGTSTGSSTGSTGATTAPTFVAYSVTNNSNGPGDPGGPDPKNGSASSQDVTVTIPTGTEVGDLLLMFVGCDCIDDDDNLPAAWQRVISDQNYGWDNQSSYVYYRFATAADVPPAQFIVTKLDNYYGGMQVMLRVYRGVNAVSGQTINAKKSQTDTETKFEMAASITSATPTITTTVDNCLVVAGLSPDTSYDYPSVTTWPTGAEADEVTANPNTPGGYASIYASDGVLATAGIFAASAFVWAPETTPKEYAGWETWVIALAPSD